MKYIENKPTEIICCDFCGREIHHCIEAFLTTPSKKDVLFGNTLLLASPHPAGRTEEYDICWECDEKFKQYLDNKKVAYCK